MNRTPGGEEGFYQITNHMLNLLTHQHRLFGYGFYVQWKWARLLYFDRTGVLVSEPFDWTETTSLLHDFIWKVAHMTPEQLGYDPTAQLASESDIEKLRLKMQDQSLPKEVRRYVQKAFLCKATQPAQETPTNLRNSSTDEPDELPLTLNSRLQVDGNVFRSLARRSVLLYTGTFALERSSSESGARVAVAERTRAFLVGRPHFAAESLVGRCTRGYIAFDLQDDIFCFLKDSWRPLTSRRFGPEHLVYERLHHHKVVHIASLICGGDVGGHRAQVTRIQEYMPPEKKPVPRVHYRIVVKEIGVPLTEFKTFTELAMIFGHALLAHMTAWEYAGILHHDINLGNILIDPESRSGILIDWDLSRLASELEDGPVEPDRTFRSALVLYYPRKPYRLSDDIESFIHAFRYMVLRFHRTDIMGIRSHVESYFEHSIKVGNVRLGGQSKMDYFDLKRSSFRVRNNPRLQALLDDIASGCHREFYKLVDKGPHGAQVRSPPAANRRPPTITSTRGTCATTTALCSHPSHVGQDSPPYAYQRYATLLPTASSSCVEGRCMRHQGRLPIPPCSSSRPRRRLPKRAARQARRPVPGEGLGGAYAHRLSFSHPRELRPVDVG
ncbi:hypothetical protein LXA43DRAFT_384235 [Ganoderma leucocontextum]|nr:hypothetical protein LXA43DRAFT_384235 [Ganoderma leucocontextum]